MSKVQLLKVVVLVASGFAVGMLVFLQQANNGRPEVLGKNIIVPTPTSQPILAQLKNNVNEIIDTSVKTAKETVSGVLGETSSFVQKTASQSANAISQTIIVNTVSTIMQQIEKLPAKDQQEIKEVICK